MARPWKFWKYTRSAKLHAPESTAPAFRILASGERVMIPPRDTARAGEIAVKTGKP